MKIKNYLRLSLRDLFWATALVAVGLGWYLEHRRFSAVEGIVQFMETAGPESTEVPAFDSHVIVRGHMWAVLGERID